MSDAATPSRADDAESSSAAPLPPPKDGDDGLKGGPGPRVPLPEVEVLVHARRLSGQPRLNAPSVLDKMPVAADEILAHARRLSHNDELGAASPAGEGDASVDAASPAGVGVASLARAPRADRAAVPLEAATATISTRCGGRGGCARARARKTA